MKKVNPYLLVLFFTLFLLTTPQSNCTAANGSQPILCQCDLRQSNVDGVCQNCLVANCLLCSYDNHNICQICEKNSLLSDNGTSCMCPPVIQQPSCECVTSQINMGDQGCVRCRVENCLLCQYNNPDICDICRRGYFLEQGNNTSTIQCIACPIEFCQTCSEDFSECLQCIGGFSYDSANRQCVEPTCGGGTIFTGLACSCPVGQSLLSGACAACPSNCESCDSPTQCLKCNLGYYVDNGLCLQCIFNCLQCTSSLDCSQCQPEYTFDNEKMECSPLPAEISAIYFVPLNNLRIKGLCRGGCSSCQGFNQCKSCIQGHFLRNQRCFLCNSNNNCPTCSLTDPNQCTSCYKGYTLVQGACQLCPTHCLECFSESFCTECNLGFYLENKQCLACADNCDRCTSADQCTSAILGYVVIQSQCVQCLIGCSSCNSTDIAHCFECVDGFYLNTAFTPSNCSECPIGCQTCTSTSFCIKCNRGFTKYQDNLCYNNCQFPCSQCVKNQPKNCTACYGGYYLSAGVCTVDLTCNGLNNCVVCPLGYALQGSQCSSCRISEIPNCAGCSDEDLSTCTSCVPGFTLASNGCQACQSGCSVCQSLNYCLTCQTGFYMKMKNKQKLGICKECSVERHCATCTRSSQKCTSCIESYTLTGFKCRSPKFIRVKFVFATVYQRFMLLIFSFRKGLAQKMGGFFSNRDHLFTFRNCRRGSTLSTIQITLPDQVDANSTFHTLNQQLTSGTDIGGVILQSAAIEPEGFQTQATQEETFINLGLVLGLSIPLALLVVILLFLAFKKINTVQYSEKYSEQQSNEKIQVLGEQA